MVNDNGDSMEFDASAHSSSRATFLISQRCTAASTDTRIAVARFPGQLWSSTHAWLSVKALPFGTGATCNGSHNYDKKSECHLLWVGMD
jgi:hypothetical protein